MTSSSSKVDDPSPSAARRRALRDADSQSNWSALCNRTTSKKGKPALQYPLERYYGLLDRLLRNLEQAWDARNMDEVYVYGIRFATVSIDIIPTHAQYHQAQYSGLRKQNAQQVERVLQKLEKVTARMDAEELTRQRDEAERHRQLQQQQHKQQQFILEEKQQQQKHQQNQQQLILEQYQKAKVENSSTHLSNADHRKSLALRAQEKLRALQTLSDRQDASTQKESTSNVSNETKAKHFFRQALSMKQKSEIKVPTNAASSAQIARDYKLVKSNPPIQITSPPKVTTKALSARSLQTMKARENEDNQRQILEARKRLNDAAEGLARNEREHMDVEKKHSVNVSTYKQAPLSHEASVGNAKSGIKSKENVTTVPEIRVRVEESNLQEVEIISADQNVISTSEDIPSLKHNVEVKDDLSILSDSINNHHCGSTSNTPIQFSAYGTPISRMTPEERKTIELLQTTIEKQEARLADLDDRNLIKSLRREAKTKLAEGDRAGAMQCLAKKKRFEQNIDALKGAIFTMETQILLLESAVEDREVSKAMQTATEAMESLQAEMGNNVDLKEMNRAMEDFTQEVVNDVYLDEDDLMSELREPSDEELPDDPNQFLSMLLPDVPDDEIQKPVSQSHRKNAKKVRERATWY